MAAALSLKIRVTPRPSATPQNRQAGGRPGDRAAALRALIPRGALSTPHIYGSVIPAKAGIS